MLGFLLHACLASKLDKSLLAHVFDRRQVGLGQLGCSVDSCRAKFGSLFKTHSGDQQQVVVLFYMGLTNHATTAGGICVIVPSDGLSFTEFVRTPSRDDRKHFVPTLSVGRHDVCELVSAYALVAQNQVHLFRGWHIVYLQLVSISSQLNQRCDLGFASELRVRDGIFTSVG